VADTFVSALEDIVDSEDAVFALDSNFLIILWNRESERLLGRPAYQALGRRCYEILCGRDIYGNRYCGRGCPVAEQARFHPEEPLRSIEADVPTAAGVSRLRIATFRAPSTNPSNSTLVHVLRRPGEAPSLFERNLERSVWKLPPARRTPEAPPAAADLLSVRERETLRAMGKGYSTERIATEMGISPTTVRNHIAKILGKLEVHTKVAAVAVAYRNGLMGSEMPLLPVRRPDRSGPDGETGRGQPARLRGLRRAGRPVSRLIGRAPSRASN
jgi:DNA-binding CsgD family transcriptional regulator